MSITIRESASSIASRTPFNACNLTAYVPGPYGVGSYKYLPEIWRDDIEETAVDYVVYSYKTPIAWHTPDGWVYPSHTYSVSTTRHQGVVRQAIGGHYFEVLKDDGTLDWKRSAWIINARTGTLAASRRAAEVFA